MWGGRFGDGPDDIMEEINASIGFDQRLAHQDVAGSMAHCQMLIDTGILSQEDGRTILDGLNQIEKEISEGTFTFSRALEDIHMNIESRLSDIIGPTGGRLHTARSRNDQVATDFKLYIRDTIDHLHQQIQTLQTILAQTALSHANTLMPGFTHLQIAQPVSYGHHLLAYVEMLNRDKGRLHDARARLNQSPLGAAALAGTSFPIDRHRTAKALGFDKPTDNSIDSVSDRDFAIDFLYASAVCAMHLSRLAEDFIIYNSDAFNLISFKDSMLTGSSIMPQKKNPDPAELIRGKVGINYGKLNAMLTIMKGLPMSYFKDLQDDKILVFDGYDTLKDTLIMSGELINAVKPLKDKMYKMANKGFTTSTDFADYLVKEKKLSFRESYSLATKLVTLAEKNNKNLSELSLVDIKKIYKDLDKNVLEVLSVKNSMNTKKSYGGTASNNVTTMIKKYKKEIK